LAAQFIAVSREGFERGVRILHFLGGSSIDVAGERAFAQTKMTISQRGADRGRRSATSSAPGASATSSSGATVAGESFGASRSTSAIA
jgi:hypothetical protein